MTAENDKAIEISRALVSNKWLGVALIFEIGEKQSVHISDSESQLEIKADKQVVRETVCLLQQAGVLALSETDDSLSLTSEGIQLYSKLVQLLDKPNNQD